MPQKPSAQSTFKHQNKTEFIIQLLKHLYSRWVYDSPYKLIQQRLIHQHSMLMNPPCTLGEYPDKNMASPSKVLTGWVSMYMGSNST